MLFNIIVVAYFILGLSIAIWSDYRVQQAVDAEEAAVEKTKTSNELVTHYIEQLGTSNIRMRYAERTLSDIAKLNQTDPMYPIWARTMAANAVKLLEGTK